MATTQNITSNYVGKDAGVYISAAVKTADTIAKDVLTVLPNVKYKASIHKLTPAESTVDFACDFTAAGTVTLADVYLTPKKLMLNLELCKENFVDTWEAESMGMGASNNNLPTSFQDYFIGQILDRQAAHIDSDIWAGNATGTGHFDGFLLNLKPTGSGAVQVSGTAITSSNVVAEIGKLYDAIPDAVFTADDLKIVVSPNVARAYARALSTSGYQTNYSVGEKPLDFEGRELIVINGLPSNTMLAFEKSNMFFGTSLLADFNEISILDMKDKDLSDNVRFKMVYSAGVQYGVAADITMYFVS